MKKILLCLLVVFVSKYSMAQDQYLFWKYKEYDGAMAFTVPGILPKIGSLFIKDKAERRLVRRMGKMRFMYFENENPISDKDFARFSKPRGKNALQDLIQVRDGKTNVRIMVKENGKRIRKLVVLVQDEGEFVLLSLKGRFRYSDLNKIFEKTEREASEKKKDGVPLKIPVKVHRIESL